MSHTRLIKTDKERLDRLRTMSQRYSRLARQMEKRGDFKKAEELLRASNRCLDEIRRIS